MPTQRRWFVHPKRLIRPDDEFRRGFPRLDFSEHYTFRTSGEPVLISDPTYVADVYNSKGKVADYLRANGVFIMNFGGDVAGPVWYRHPYLLLPISIQSADEQMEPPKGVSLLAEKVFTDSGSFVFLPLRNSLLPTLRRSIGKVIADKNAVIVLLPPNRWTVFYEQGPTPRDSYRTFHRNIVVRADR
jgi:hypothetical protein